jgi:hypothetical protein
MARTPDTRTVVRTFLASPGDVRVERDIAFRIVGELNTIWSKFLGLSLELVRWETHAYPGVGEDAQSVINEQIEDDYDLFIGIMWTRFGTPTQRAGSGTEEEYNRAYQRYKADPDGVRIMFYFKSAPLTETTDGEQIESVSRFRTQVGAQGVLYWTFTDENEFSDLLRLHLSRQMQYYHGKYRSASVFRLGLRQRVELEQKRLLLPYTLLYRQIPVMTQILKLNREIKTVGREFRIFSEKAQSMRRAGHTRADLELLMSKGAVLLSRFVVQSSPALDRLDTSFGLFMESVSKAAPYFVGRRFATLWTRRLILRQLRSLWEAIDSGIPIFQEWQSIVTTFEKIDPIFRESSRTAVTYFERVVTVWTRARDLVHEAELAYTDV